MNIMKFFLISMSVGITALSAMDSMISNALQAGRPLTHKDIILTMMNNKTFSPEATADHNGRIYTLTSSWHDTQSYIESFRYTLERPISSLKILNYKTDIIGFLHFVLVNDTVDDKIKKLTDPENIKGHFTETYKVNYRNIFKTGIVLAAGVTLVMLTRS